MRAAVYGLACLVVTFDVTQAGAWERGAPVGLRDAMVPLAVLPDRPQSAGHRFARTAFQDRTGMMGGCGAAGLATGPGEIKPSGAEMRVLEDSLALRLPGVGPSLAERNRVASPCLS